MAIPEDTGVTPVDWTAEAATKIGPIRGAAGAGAGTITGAMGAVRAGARAVFTGTAATAVAERLARAINAAAALLEGARAAHAAITTHAADLPTAVMAAFVRASTQVAKRGAAQAGPVLADTVRATREIVPLRVDALPLGIADIACAGVAVIGTGGAVLRRVGASPVPIALIPGAGVAIIRAGGSARLIADDALACAGADSLLARLAGRRRRALGGTGAWLTGAVAGAPSGAALPRLGTRRPGVTTAGVRRGGLLPAEPGQQPTEGTPDQEPEGTSP
jgi:hypothetical protein